MNDDELQDVITSTTTLMKSGYNWTGIVPLGIIDELAYLVEAHHIGPDSEFKTICYEWEARREEEGG